MATFEFLVMVNLRITVNSVLMRRLTHSPSNYDFFGSFTYFFSFFLHVFFCFFFLHTAYNPIFHNRFSPISIWVQGVMSTAAMNILLVPHNPMAIISSFWLSLVFGSLFSLSCLLCSSVRGPKAHPHKRQKRASKFPGVWGNLFFFLSPRDFSQSPVKPQCH